MKDFSFMKLLKVIIFLLIFLSIAVFSQQTILNDNMVILETTPSWYKCWKPDTNQTKLAIQEISKFIANNEEYNLENIFPHYKQKGDNKNHIKNIRRNIDEISKIFPEYKVQFMGIFVEKEKRILCNFLPNNDDFGSWKESAVFVLGGGASFWRIEYDIKTSKLYNIEINGPK